MDFDKMPMFDLVAAEQLAKLLHETYERLAPSFGYRTRRLTAMPWEQIPENQRLLAIATATEVLSALDQDPGEQQTMLFSKQADGKVRVDFQKRLKWFVMDKEHAINFALTILQHCDVPVNITLNPPPASSSEPV